MEGPRVLSWEPLLRLQFSHIYAPPPPHTLFSSESRKKVCSGPGGMETRAGAFPGGLPAGSWNLGVMP